LHYERPDALRNSLPNYRPRTNEFGLDSGGGEHFPSSAYLAVLG